MSIIETCALTKYYGKERGIIDVDLTVEEGEVFGFIGPNGAGKSTMIRTLLGLIKKTSGEARVFGKSIDTESIEILRDVGYLPGEISMYSGMRVSEMIELSAKLHKRDCGEYAKELCERLQLDTRKKVDALSLGNKKKVGIVCAMQHMPKLYIFDEPTSGLDPLMQKEFYRLVEERKAQGATVFLSSHVLSEIQKHCDRAAIIRKGSVIACGSVEELANSTAKRVVLHGVTDITDIQGIADKHATEDSCSFLYQGDMKQLMQKLATLDITDLTITEPELDEVFMHYYTEGGEKQ